jgi:hypothetical protein
LQLLARARKRVLHLDHGELAEDTGTKR